MRKKFTLPLLILFTLGLNAFSANNPTQKAIEKISKNTMAFKVAACPDNVIINIDGSSTLTICEGESVNFTGAISPEPDSTIQWQYNAGSGWIDITINGNGESYTTDALTTNTSFRRKVNYKECDTDYFSDPVDVTLNPVPTQPTVSVLDADCGVPGSASIDGYVDGLYTYTFSPDDGISVDASGNIINFTAGQEYSVAATNTDGCESSASALFTIQDALEEPDQPTVTAVDATCDVQGSATITNYIDSYTYSFIPDDGIGVDASGNITSFTTGQAYTVMATSADGCESLASESFTIEGALNAPDQPTVSVLDADCGVPGSASIDGYVDGLYTYTFSPDDGISVDASGNIINFTAGQEYSVTATNTDGCESSASALFTIQDALEEPDQPTVSAVNATCLAQGSATITNYIDSYTYSFIPDDGIGVDASGNITSFTTGQAYTVTATSADGCESLASESFTIQGALDAPDQPTITLVDADCGVPGSASIDGYVDGLYTYTFSPDDGISVDASGNIINFTAGQEYSVTATNTDGCESSASALFTIQGALEEPDQPTVTAVNATCLAQGSATITNYDGNYTYTFTPSGPGVDVGGNIIGFTTGQAYTVTATSADGCESLASESFTIEGALNAPDQPTVSVLDADCGAPGSASIDGYVDGLYTYTFSPDDGISVDASGNIINFTAGQEYSVTATNTDGCESSASALFTIQDALEEPDQPTVTAVNATCLAQGSATITNYIDSYTYSFIPDDGIGVDASGNITSFTTGQAYTVMATSADGCESLASESFTIEGALNAPDQPTVSVLDADCGVPGSASINGYVDGLYTYTFSPDDGISVDASGNIINFTAGQEYSVTATNTDGCESSASALFTIQDALEEPAQPTVTAVDATCDVQGSATIINYDGNYTYTFTPSGPGVDASGNIIGFTTGQAYTVMATSADGCESLASESFTIEGALNAPDQPTVSVLDADCGVPGSASIDGYVDGLYTYTFSPDDGISVDASGNIINFTAGQEYSVTATNTDGCESSASALFTIQGALEEPDQPTVTAVDATCDVQGSATITNYDGNYTYTFTPSGPGVDVGGNIIGFTTGQAYTVTATSADGCESLASESFTIEGALNAPDQPTVSVLDADCGVPGSASIDGYVDGLYTYTFSPDDGISVDASGNIINFTAGQEYSVTATNTDGCESSASALFTIQDALEEPDQPTVSAVNATCLAQGSATITNYIDSYTYSFIPDDGIGVDASGNIIGFTTGQAYTVTATSADGCESLASESFTIEGALNAPDQPTVSLVNADCGVPGSGTVSNYDGLYTYTFSPDDGISVDASGNIINFTAGQEYSVTATNTDGCESSASALFTIQDALEEPDQPTVTAVNATCLAQGSATITNYIDSYTYSFIPDDGIGVDASGNIIGFTTGQAYTVMATSADGCESLASESFTIEGALNAPDQPTVSVLDADCGVPGSGAISNYDGLYTYTFSPDDGISVDASGNIINFTAGQEYSVTATNTDGCESAASALFTIQGALEEPAQPTVTAVNATCVVQGSATITNYIDSYTYSFIPDDGIGVDASGNITSFTTGQAYTVMATSADGCESLASESFTIEGALNAPDQPTVSVLDADCGVPGSASIDGYVDGLYTYTFSPDDGISVDASGNIINFTAGQEYSVAATNTDGCESSASALFTIQGALEEPDQPTVSAVNATCLAQGSATITNYIDSYTYSFIPDDGIGVDASGNITSFTTGQAYTVMATSADGCESLASESFTIEGALNAPDQPTVSVLDADCGVPGSASIDGYVDGLYTYTFSPDDGISVDASGNIINFTAGQEYSVAATNTDGCESSASALFTIQDALEEPDQPTVTAVNATCLAQGSATITNYIDSYTYSFIPDDGIGVDASGNITGFTTGQAYTVMATSADGCESVASEPFTIQGALDAPDQPTVSVLDADCGVPGSASIDGYVDGLYTYTFSPDDGISVDASGNIINFTAGQEYSVTATNTDGCESSASALFTIQDALEEPDQPTVSAVNATCLAQGSATITNYIDSYTYSFIPDDGIGVDASGNITSFTTGQAYTVMATSADGCESLASESFTIEGALNAPDQPTVSVLDADCGVPGSASINGYVDGLYTYTFSPDDGISVDASGNIINFTAGQEYSVTATNTDGCESAASALFTIQGALEEPDQPTVSAVNATCLAQGSATITNYNENYTYSFSPSGPNVDATGNITSFTTGQAYTVTATSADGCESLASESFTIEGALNAPDQPTVSLVNADCGVPGSGTVSNYDASYIYTFTPSGPGLDASGNIINFTAGQEYSVTATNTDGCESSASALFTIQDALEEPDQPTVSAVNATCLAQGSATITNYIDSYTYSFIPDDGIGVDASGNITSFTTGQAYTVMATSADGCESLASESFTIEGALNAPDQPTVSVLDADCGVPGSGTVSNYDASYIYTFTPSGPGLDASGNIINFTAGQEYSVTATNTDGCESSASALFTIQGALNAPNAPDINVSDECAQSVLTASNYTGELLWNTGDNTESIIVTQAGEYSVTQTVNGCESELAAATANPKTIPAITAVVENEPLFCGGNGSLELSFTDVPTRLFYYTVEYDGGSFSSVTVFNNRASISAPAGTYNNLKITVNGCTSAAGINASLSDPNPPVAPTIDVFDDCDQSVLTANGETGAVYQWSNGQTGENIVVTAGGTFTVNQTINGCKSAESAAATAAPKTTPAAPDFSVTDNCDGTSTLTATTYEVGATLQWSNNTSGVFTIVNSAGDYSLTQTVDGCESESTTKTANPKNAPTLTATGINPVNCGDPGTINFTFTNVPNDQHTISYNNNQTLSVNVNNGNASIDVDAGSYNNLTITIDGCNSTENVNIRISDPVQPDAPLIDVIDDCDQSVLTAIGEIGATFEWSNGATGESIVVTRSGSFTVNQTINGCTSAESAPARTAPKTTPDAPDFSVTDNCDGTSTLTATTYEAGATLTWSNGQATETIIVNSAGDYSLTQTVNGCESESTTKTANPKNAPTLAATGTNPANCGDLGTINFTFTNVSNGQQTITYNNNQTLSVNVNNGNASIDVSAGSYNNLTITIDGCTSTQDVDVTISDPNPPNPPAIDVSNECGQTILTASGNLGASFLWSTGETTQSIIVNDAGEYNVTQTVNECTSNPAFATAVPRAIPTISAAANNPEECDGPGSIDFTFTGVPNGTYDIDYDGGSFPNVQVSNNTASVQANAGTYSNMTISVAGCASSNSASVTLSEPPTPPAPFLSVQNNCGESILTAINLNTGATVEWNTGETTESIIVTEAGEYSVVQIVNGCLSNAATRTITPKQIPSFTVTEIDPISCGGDGSLSFRFTNVPDGTYDIFYDNNGVFNNLEVKNNVAVVLAKAGTYNNLKITINGCSSPNGVNASLSEPNAPDAPTIVVDNLCGESVLTATNLSSNATIEWSTGATTESITVTDTKEYSVTQELNGCISDAATATADPNPIPGIPDFIVIDNCNGTSRLVASVYDEQAELEWSTGETSNIILVTDPGNYSLKQTIGICTSEETVKVASPKIAPTLNAVANNPEACGVPGSIDFVFTGVPDGTYSISYESGSFDNVLVTDNAASVMAEANTYDNLGITVNGCPSSEVIGVTLSEPDAPAIPDISVVNQCGETVLTATNFDDNSTLRWNTGETEEIITVNSSGDYSVQQILNGCRSDARVVTAQPKIVPDTPDFSVTDNCDGTSVLSAVSFENNAILNWNTGESDINITVLDSGRYSLTQILDGCKSASVTKEAAPKTRPTIDAVGINPQNCGDQGTIDFTFTGVPDGVYDILYENGSFPSLQIKDNETQISATVGTYNNLKVTLNECESGEDVDISLSEPDAPPAPVVFVENNCDESVLTVSDFEPSATLFWNTGETSSEIIVSDVGTYSVTQKLNDCTSDAASVVAEPKIAKGKPKLEVFDFCGESKIVMNDLPSNTWFTWEYNDVENSVQADSIFVNETGNYIIYQSIDECVGEDTTIFVNPVKVPTPPISFGDITVCAPDDNTELTAEAIVIDENAELVWYDAASGGNEIDVPVLNTVGTVTYYAEAQNPLTGCTSPVRTPVQLSLLEAAGSFVDDATIIAKPYRNVAVLIFPQDMPSYQWYLNDTEIEGATNQYYYIPESQRQNENTFAVEVEISNGCAAMFSYSFSDLLSSGVLTGTNDLKVANIFNFKVYPNPANHILNISVDASMIINEPDLRAKIFSANGMCVSEFEVTNVKQTIDTRVFNPGMYSIVLYNTNGTYQSKKFIISH